MINLYPHQEEFIQQLREALRKHNAVLGQASVGFGKCLKKGTEVIMFNGEFKKVEDIEVGDILIGPDSTPRKVLSLGNGFDYMYQILNKKGDSYFCNREHILSLRMTNLSKGKKIKDYEGKYYYGGELIEISVENFLQCSKDFQKNVKAWKCKLDFNDKSELTLDPYFLGIWLGDGSSNTPTITTPDIEIKNFLIKFADYNNCKTRIEYNSVNSENIHIIRKSNIAGENFIKNKLNSLNLLNNKHIPHIYKISSKDSRLKLLAGILDSDGHFMRGGYELTLKSEKLFDDVLFLARSLGFSCYKKKIQKKCYNNGKIGTYFRCYISGEGLEKIPTILERKQPTKRILNKNVLYSSIEVIPTDKKDYYYGFTLDGDGLFVLSDFTVTHNTVAAAYMCKQIISKNKTMFFCVHTKDLLTQTYKAFDKFKIDYGIIASGYPMNLKAPIQICSMNTLYRRMERYKRPDLLCVDEAHLACASSWSKVIEHYKARGSKLIGLTASPHRLSGEGLGMHFDTMVQGKDVSWLIQKGFLSKYRIFAPSSPNLAKLHTRMGDYVTSEAESLMDKPSIVGDAIKHWRKYADNKVTVCFCVSIKHSKHVCEKFNKAGIPAAHLDGECSIEERRKIINDLADGKIKVLTNCQLFTAGFDLSLQSNKDITVECVIFLRPTQSLSLYIQMSGRSLRKKSEPAIILDHANLVSMHGLPDDLREWSLEGNKGNKKPKEEGGVKVDTCPKCFAVQLKGSKTCKFCGWTFEVKERPILHVDGELVEIDHEKLRRERLKAQGKCSTLEELVEEGKRRKYKRPYMWAKYVMQARQKRKLHAKT